MKREQQKAYNAENYPASVLRWLNEATDRAYDDIESRTCERCKYSQLNRSTQIGFCTNPPIKTFQTDLGIWFPLTLMRDFSCNKWEQNTTP